MRNQLSAVVILVQRVETSQRGYLLTGRDVYLAPFETAADELPQELDKLSALVADNSVQHSSSASWDG